MDENLLASTNNFKLTGPGDALDVMSRGVKGMIFTLDDIGEDFFDLKNRIAGETFQKFATYNFPVVFVVPADHGLGERVTELAREHKRHNLIRFCETVAEAGDWLTEKLVE